MRSYVEGMTTPTKGRRSDGQAKVFETGRAGLPVPREKLSRAEEPSLRKSELAATCRLLGEFGHSVGEAASWFIDYATAESTGQEVGSHYAGWLSFRALWDDITAAQPDLLS